MMNWTGRKTYSALEDGDCEASREKQPAPAPAPILLRSTGLWLFATCVAIILSFSLGRIFPKAERSAVAPNNIVPTFPTSPQVFVHNRTFSENTATTEQAWSDMFPNGTGFFRHPTLAPRRTTLSVYHYLHCLEGIRKSYWTIHDLAVAGEKLEDPTSLPAMVRPGHISHCIDLLRLALVCNPDLTVEVENTRRGVHGFGETHQCVDWSAVRTWTAQYQQVQA